MGWPKETCLSDDARDTLAVEVEDEFDTTVDERGTEGLDDDNAGSLLRNSSALSSSKDDGAFICDCGWVTEGF